MAGSVNKVILVGNLGKDPEVRSFQNGGKVVNLTVATSESWNDKTSGERKERTEWHKVVIKNDRVAATAEKYLKKGAKVYIEGTLETRKWMDSQSGQEKYTTEVIVGPFRGEMTMLSGRGEEGGGFESRDGESRGGGYGGGGGSGGGGARQQPSRGGGGGGGPSWDTSKAGSDLDDEIPF